MRRRAHEGQRKLIVTVSWKCIGDCSESYDDNEALYNIFSVKILLECQKGSTPSSKIWQSALRSKMLATQPRRNPNARFVGKAIS